MTEYTDRSKYHAEEWITANLDQISYNGTGMPLEFIPQPSLRSTQWVEHRDTIVVSNRGCRPAYFLDKWCDNVISVGNITQGPFVRSRDASVDAEYVDAHRILMLPLDINITGSFLTSGNIRRKFIFAFVSEAHGVFIQNNRRWLPPNVIIMFPLSSMPVFRPSSATVVLSVATIGFIMSPYAYMVPDIGFINNYGCTVFIGNETQLAQAYTGPRSHAFRYVTFYDNPPWAVNEQFNGITSAGSTGSREGDEDNRGEEPLPNTRRDLRDTFDEQTDPEPATQNQEHLEANIGETPTPNAKTSTTSSSKRRRTRNDDDDDERQ